MQFKKLSMMRLVTANLLVFLFQYIGLVLTTLTPHTMPVWFATGTACAFVFMRGNAILPGVWLGSFLAYFLYAKTNLELAGLAATIFTLQTFIIRWLSYRSISPTLIFYQRKLAVKFILYSSVVMGLASYLLIRVCYSSLTHPIPFESLWLQWSLANWNGLLMITIAILTWDYYFPQLEELKLINKLYLSAHYLILFVLMGLLLATHTLMGTLLLMVMLLLQLAMMGLKWGWCGIVAANFFIAMLVSFAGFVQPINVFTLEIVQVNLTACMLLGLILAAQNPFKYQI